MPFSLRKAVAAATAVGALAAMIGVAQADNITNNVVVGGNATIAAGGSTTITYKVVATNSPNGDVAGCNVGTEFGATLTINVPAGVTVDDSTLEFVACGNDGAKSAVFTSGTPSSGYAITHAMTGGKAGSLWGSDPNWTLVVTGTAAQTPPADTTPPTVTCVPAASDGLWHATDRSVTCTATDPSGLSASTPSPQVLSTSVSAGSDDANASTGSYQFCDVNNNCASAGPISGWKIDKKKPTMIQFNGSIASAGSYHFGSVPANDMNCTAEDSGSGLASCAVTGYQTKVGSHTLTATARDNVGNSDTATLGYTVLAWNLSGFYQPIDMSAADANPAGTESEKAGVVWNAVKNGSTVPLKFEVFAANELTDPATTVDSLLKAVQIPCSPTGTTDDVEVLATGATILRYDTSAGQFVFNWQTPKKIGYCYKVTMTTKDGSHLSAFFKLK